MKPSWLVALGLVAGWAQLSHADIWSYRDSTGTAYYTNVKPKPSKKRPWRRVVREAPAGKVVGRRGRCSRCDLIPAKDRGADRFTRYDEYIVEAARLFQIPHQLIRAVIEVESDYDPRVVSAVGARGLMQLMPAVVNEMGVDDPHDPRQGILGGTRLLRILANRYQGDLSLTIAAYHAGPGAVAKYNRQVPPYARTRRYLRKVSAKYEDYRRLQP